MTTSLPTLTPSDVFKATVETVDYLSARWADEREYEDIAEYADVIKKKLPRGASFKKMLKRPFGFEFTIDGLPSIYWRVGASGNSIVCRCFKV